MIVIISQKEICDKHHYKCDSLERNYLDYFTDHPLLPPTTTLLPIPNHLMNAKKILERFSPSLIIFSGGNDVDLKEDAYQSNDLAPTRDKIESFLFEYSIKNKTPIIAICRGFQHINLLVGGTVRPHLKDHPPQPHLVNYEGQSYRVNSFHNQGVLSADLAPDLKATVLAENSDIVEAYTNRSDELPPLLAIQWHPERENTDNALFMLLMKSFLEKAALI